MVDERKRIPARFYRTASGVEPVRECLRSLDAPDRRAVGMDLKDVEYGWPVGMPLCRSLGRGLWEIRSSISQGRIARVIFCIEGGEMVVLHGFIKKTRRTSPRDIELALKRRSGA